MNGEDIEDLLRFVSLPRCSVAPLLNRVLRHLRLSPYNRRDVPPNHRTAVALLAVCTCGAALVAQQPPTFRAEIDSVQLDVRVLDGEGRFVRDLGRSDLQVFEDGQPQTITTFAIVDI